MIENKYKKEEKDKEEKKENKSPCPFNCHDICSICLSLRCSQLGKKTSMCFKCRYNENVLNILEKDEKGCYIDPALHITLPTCSCGQILLGGI